MPTAALLRNTFSGSQDSLDPNSESASAIFRHPLSSAAMVFQQLFSLPSLSNTLISHELWTKRFLVVQYIHVTRREQVSISDLHFYLLCSLIKALSTALNVSAEVWEEWGKKRTGAITDSWQIWAVISDSNSTLMNISKNYSSKWFFSRRVLPLDYPLSWLFPSCLLRPKQGGIIICFQ